MKRFLCVLSVIAFSNIPGWNLGSAILLLASLIFVHELGHFLVAKWIGLAVSTFSLGFGPRLAGFTWHETDVRLSLVPLGGYVKLADQELEQVGEIKDPEKLKIKFSWKYLLFYAGGIIANVVVSVLIFFCLFLNHNFHKVTPSYLIVNEVMSGTAADKAHLKPMDKVRGLDSFTFPSDDFGKAVAYIQSKPNKTVTLTIERQGVIRTFRVKLDQEAGKGKLGVNFQYEYVTNQRRPLKLNDISQSIKMALVETSTQAWEMLRGFGKLIIGQVSVKDISGPISIVKISSQAVKYGLTNFFHLAALLSLNLALVNAFPIPLLDGGYIFMFLVEKSYGKQLPTFVKERLLTVGFIIVVSLVVLITILDVMKLLH